MRLLVIQQCYNCGRDMDRILEGDDLEEFLEDHPNMMPWDCKQISNTLYAKALPETQCDPCLDQYLEYKYGPEQHIEMEGIT